MSGRAGDGERCRLDAAPVTGPPRSHSKRPGPAAPAAGGRARACLHLPTCPPPQALDRLAVKAYDIRGTVPDELNTRVARDVGALFVRLTGTSRLAVARDMRDSSPWLAAALADGAASAGADVLDAGLGSTDYA
jgi:Phosphoglucomutase/phosphomannomutase, alpha/beta/alpha domain I